MSFSRHLLLIVVAAAAAAPLPARTQDVPVIQMEPPETQTPVIEAEPPPTDPVTIRTPEPPAVEQPLASDPLPQPARVPSSAASSVRDEAAATSSLPPLPSRSAIVDPLATVSLPDVEGPAAVVPNASGTPIVVQPPVIEPPEVIDEPWTLGRAIPWLIAGLLIGGSLVLLFLQRRRRRIVAWRTRSVADQPAETGPLPTTVVEIGPAPPAPAKAESPEVLVRKVDRPSETAERAGRPF